MALLFNDETIAPGVLEPDSAVFHAQDPHGVGCGRGVDALDLAEVEGEAVRDERGDGDVVHFQDLAGCGRDDGEAQGLAVRGIFAGELVRPRLVDAVAGGASGLLR